MSSPELATNVSKDKELFAYSDKIESFGLVDGPGVRSILFLSGCPLRCLYCHNPEMQSGNCGSRITQQEAFDKLMRYRGYWGEKGGITVSGGEPLQSLDFLIELGKLAKKEGVSYVIDTSAASYIDSDVYKAKFDELLKVSDLFLLDLKALDPELHKKVTGKTNENILACYHYLAEKKFPLWIRYVLVPGLTDGEETLRKSKDFLKSLGNVERLEVLPYHALAIPKYEALHREYLLKDTPTPTKEEIERANQLLESDSFTKYLER